MKRLRDIALICIIISISYIGYAAIDFQLSPHWTSGDSRCSTGGVAGDVDNDGYMDFIIGNGNDMTSEPEVVYFGTGDGLEIDPSWVSADSDFSGHCVIGDLDGDGLPELVLGNYKENPGFSPGTTKIYYNLGTGFESEPSWISSDLNNTFSVALADVDGDGDLDVATANGEAYSSSPQANEIYFNDMGLIADTPGWISGDVDSSYDLMFADYDRDGDLDLAVANAGTSTRVYQNDGAGLETYASWSASTADSDNSLTWGDINGDGWLELIVATNAQLDPGTGTIRIFSNNSGTLETTPSTVLTPANDLGSAIYAHDLDGDGDVDLAAGSWWGSVIIYENLGGSLTTDPVWTSSNTFVVEALDGLKFDLDMVTSEDQTFIYDGSTKIFLLDKIPVFEVCGVSVEGTPLTPSDYCYDRHAGWVSIGVSLTPGQEITVCYKYSIPNYLVGSSWGDGGAQGPNYAYLNLAPTPTPGCINHGDVNFDESITAGDAQLAFSIAIGTYTPTFAEECAADCNASGLVTAADAQKIFGAALGLDSCEDPI